MWEIEQLSQENLRQVIADPRWIRMPDFLVGFADENDVQRRPADRVWAWLADKDPQAAAAVRLRHWPRGEAAYRHARPVAGAIVQDWTIHGVTLRLLWPTGRADATRRAVDEALALDPPAARVIMVRDNINADGPALSVYDAHGAVDTDEPQWPELALVLGGRAPYWPVGLRDIAVMARWLARQDLDGNTVATPKYTNGGRIQLVDATHLLRKGL